MSVASTLLAAGLALAAVAPGQGGTGQDTKLTDASAPAAPPRWKLHRVERGEDRQHLLVPRDETLRYDVRVGLGVLGDPRVGRVTLSSKVEDFHTSLLVLGDGGGAGAERVELTAHAGGKYMVYELDETITTMILPQEWPAVIYRTVQKGTENRRRELMLGVRDGVRTAEYRADGHCGGCKLRQHFNKPDWAWEKEHHCKKCKRGEHRVWGKPRSREIPPDALDMLSAVWMARTMVREDLDEVRFPLMIKLEVWEVTLKRGAKQRQMVRAGEFESVQVLLEAKPLGDAKRREEFKGLFGLHGAISIWMEETTGTPVLIGGVIPAGPLDLEVNIELRSYEGTPEGFGESD